MTTPPWASANTGGPYSAGLIDQFLGAHAITYVYTGTAILDSSSATSTSVGTFGVYIDQPFTMPALTTTLGRLVLYFTLAGTTPDVTLSVQADVGGNPSGTPLLSVVMPSDFFTYFSGGPMRVPIPLAGLVAGTKYHVVLAPAGTSGNDVLIAVNNTVPSGLGFYQTSPDGVTWTTHTGCVRAQWFTGNTGPLIHTFEDGGLRWTYTPTSPLGPCLEYTGSLRSARNLGFTNGQLTSVS